MINGHVNNIKRSRHDFVVKKEKHFIQIDDATGTCFQGRVTADYDTLVELFGNPLKGDEYKTDVEWAFKYNGTVVTIYNWKNGRSYLGSDGLKVEDIKLWNIGGFDINAVWVVEGFIERKELLLH